MAELEERLAAYARSKYRIAVANGIDALQIAKQPSAAIGATRLSATQPPRHRNGAAVAWIRRRVRREAILDPLPMQPGDVRVTIADVGDLERAVGFQPRTSVEDGVAKLVEWYEDCYKVRDG